MSQRFIKITVLFILSILTLLSNLDSEVVKTQISGLREMERDPTFYVYKDYSDSFFFLVTHITYELKVGKQCYLSLLTVHTSERYLTHDLGWTVKVPHLLLTGTKTPRDGVKPRL